MCGCSDATFAALRQCALSLRVGWRMLACVCACCVVRECLCAVIKALARSRSMHQCVVAASRLLVTSFNGSTVTSGCLVADAQVRCEGRHNKCAPTKLFARGSGRRTLAEFMFLWTASQCLSLEEGHWGRSCTVRQQLYMSTGVTASSHSGHTR